MVKKKPLKVVVHPACQKDLGKMCGCPTVKPTKDCRPLEDVFEEIEKEANIWYNKYIWHPLCRIGYKIEQIPNQIKWFLQRRIRGFDDTELWDIQFCLKKWLAPRMEAWLKKGTNGYPSGLTPIEWNNILKKILWLARDSEEDERKLWCDKKTKNTWKKHQKKHNEASELLGKYLGNLWD